VGETAFVNQARVGCPTTGLLYHRIFRQFRLKVGQDAHRRNSCDDERLRGYSPSLLCCRSPQRPSLCFTSIPECRTVTPRACGCGSLIWVGFGAMRSPVLNSLDRSADLFVRLLRYLIICEQVAFSDESFHVVGNERVGPDAAHVCDDAEL
jgi:hypothetical protein